MMPRQQLVEMLAGEDRPSSGTKQLDDTGKLDDLGPGPEHHGDTARLQSGEISRARHEIRG